MMGTRSETTGGGFWGKVIDACAIHRPLFGIVSIGPHREGSAFDEDHAGARALQRWFRESISKSRSPLDPHDDNAFTTLGYSVTVSASASLAI
ncbi:hypothetical protein BLJAPNOD_06473 [Ensifer sp. M14]|uniref:Uncharacterized protein n=1 Tax=Sinorhizobium sp. M14 TaxID=430451 RepID=A0A142BP90_9HYPH|nr:hypothetical protein pSinB_031 [Sinorhizobium sp. M14]RDL46279.1 hypothetical protein BLJAPNOD_06473 [Ensifer sp. M14]